MIGDESTHVMSMHTVGGRRQGMCTCGWRSSLQNKRADAALLMLDHATSSPCRPLLGDARHAGRVTAA
jgi:hypothetical protein